MLTPANLYFFQPTKPRLSIWSTAKARVNWTSGRRECLPCRGLDSLGFSGLISLCEIWDLLWRGTTKPEMDGYLRWYGQDDGQDDGQAQRKVSQFTWRKMMTSSWLPIYKERKRWTFASTSLDNVFGVMSFALTYEDWVTYHLANPMTTGAGSGESTCRCEVQILAALCMLPCWSSAGYEVAIPIPLYIW